VKCATATHAKAKISAHYFGKSAKIYRSNALSWPTEPELLPKVTKYEAKDFELELAESETMTKVKNIPT
jgi:hypothetical protein